MLAVSKEDREGFAAPTDRKQAAPELLALLRTATQPPTTDTDSLKR